MPSTPLPRGRLTSATALLDRGFSRSTIDRCVSAGELSPEPGARGIYRIVGREPSLLDDLVVVALYAPSTVFCLLTALAWHGLRPPCADLWLSVPAPGRTPDLKRLPLVCIRPRRAVDDRDIQWEKVDEVPLRFTSPARTVADCFQYRTKVGLDVALAALQSARQRRAASMEDIWRCARSSGVADVMRPYLESLQ